MGQSLAPTGCGVNTNQIPARPDRRMFWTEVSCVQQECVYCLRTCSEHTSGLRLACASHLPGGVVRPCLWEETSLGTWPRC
jgi:hypothetical protein